jgi:hypothetical protein
MGISTTKYVFPLFLEFYSKYKQKIAIQNPVSRATLRSCLACSRNQTSVRQEQVQ